MPEISTLVALILAYIKDGNSRKDSVELATIDTCPRFAEKYFNHVVRINQINFFDCLHPEVPEKIKSAYHLQANGFLNYDALSESELSALHDYDYAFNAYYNQL